MKTIISGGASSGKTEIIKELERRGYKVMHEVARIILERYPEVPAIEKERLILEEQLRQESECRGNHIFIDRGAVDIIAYCIKYLGRIPKEISRVELPRYDKVFFLERLPFVADGVRIEKDDKEAEEIHLRTYGAYLLYGYNPIMVPVMPGHKKESIDARVDFIVNRTLGKPRRITSLFDF